MEARKEWCEYVPIHEVSCVHATGSKEPWVESFGPWMLVNWIAPYHPNLAGHTAVANILYEMMER
jgi:hypothetical protein